MEVVQSATCVAFFCRCKMPHFCSELMVGKMRIFVIWTLRIRKTISLYNPLQINPATEIQTRQFVGALCVVVQHVIY